MDETWGDAPVIRCPYCQSNCVVGVHTERDTHILFWMCETCRARWHRYSAEANPRLHAWASTFIDEHEVP